MGQGSLDDNDYYLRGGTKIIIYFMNISTQLFSKCLVKTPPLMSCMWQMILENCLIYAAP